MGKILAETRGDVQEAIDIAYYAAGAGRRLTGETVPSELENKWSMSVRLPYGVIGMITPWNFPIAIPAWKAFPAIVAGNTVVLKPAEDTPWSVIKLAEVFHEAGLPKGVFNVVTGFGPTAGMPLVKHPKVKVISFTGSSATGSLLAKECSKLGKKYSLELGGKNSITVTKNADLDLAVEGVIFGAFGTTGQRCTACSRVIIDKKVKKEFTEKLVAKTESLIIGSGLEDDVDVGPLINEKALDKVERYVTSALASGDDLLTGGHKIKMNSGWFYAPTIFTNIKPDNALAQEECDLIAFPKSEFMHLLNKYFKVSLSLMEELARRLRKSDQQIEALSLSDAEHRIGVSILNLAEDMGIIRKGQVTIEKLPFQQDIANMAGTSRETVSRVLKLFEDKNLVSKVGHRLIIPDYLFFKRLFGKNL